MSDHVRHCTRRTILRRIKRCLRPTFAGRGHNHTAKPFADRLARHRISTVVGHTVARDRHCGIVVSTKCDGRRALTSFRGGVPVAIFSCTNRVSAVVAPLSSVGCCGAFLHAKFVSVSTAANRIGTCIKKVGCGCFVCSVIAVNHQRIKSAVGPCLCSLTVRGNCAPYSVILGIRRACVITNRP